ncbi:hypothetical protein B0O99DRAFT_588206 [Bisporella sp. PMI_857]|nr:hypothetical protein B0O99DRAFT_588206 [Bisporella sp. PMI_857]
MSRSVFCVPDVIVSGVIFAWLKKWCQTQLFSRVPSTRQALGVIRKGCAVASPTTSPDSFFGPHHVTFGPVEFPPLQKQFSLAQTSARGQASAQVSADSQDIGQEFVVTYIVQALHITGTYTSPSFANALVSLGSEFVIAPTSTPTRVAKL